MDMFPQGIIAAITALWLLSYLGFRRVFGYAFIVDTALSLLFVIAFAGSYAGMMTGVIAAVIVSAVIRIGRSLFGYERLSLVRYEGEYVARPRWRRYTS